MEASESAKTTGRGGVLSIRMSQDEMDALARSAERTGKSVSEYARDTLRASTRTMWRVNVWNGGRVAGPAAPLQSGGEYGGQIGGPQNATWAG